MLNLTGVPALDLAIGLALIYFLISTLAATVQEFIAAIFGLRARTLEQGLRSMLEDPEEGWNYVDKFYDHPLIKSLYRTPSVMKEAVAHQQGQTAADNQQGQTADDNQQGRTAADSQQEPKNIGRNADVTQRNALQRAAGFFKRTKGPPRTSPRAPSRSWSSTTSRRPRVRRRSLTRATPRSSSYRTCCGNGSSR